MYMCMYMYISYFTSPGMKPRNVLRRASFARRASVACVVVPPNGRWQLTCVQHKIISCNGSSTFKP